MLTPTTSKTSNLALIGYIVIILTTVLTDAQSVLAYGMDALVVPLLPFTVQSAISGAWIILGSGAFILFLYGAAIFFYSGLIERHSHSLLGGGPAIANLSGLKNEVSMDLPSSVGPLSQLGSAAALWYLPALQAISILACVESLNFIPQEYRLSVSFLLLIVVSLAQVFGVMLPGLMILFPLIMYHLLNLFINFHGIQQIIQFGWKPLSIPEHNIASINQDHLSLFSGIANGLTVLTGIQLSYSAVNLTNNGRSFTFALRILLVMVLATFSLQLVNVLGLGVKYDAIVPLPIQIANAGYGDAWAIPLNLLTAGLLLAGTQAAQTVFPIELFRAVRLGLISPTIAASLSQRNNPLAAIDMGKTLTHIRASLFLGSATLLLLVLFPSTHKLEGIYTAIWCMVVLLDIIGFIRSSRCHIGDPLFIVALFLFAVALSVLAKLLFERLLDGVWFAIMVIGLLFLFFHYLGNQPNVRSGPTSPN